MKRAAVFLVLVLGVPGLGAGVTHRATAQETETVNLVAGCQIRSLAAYTPGTPVRTITDAIAAEGANPRVWFQVPGSNDFQLYDPRSEERSSKTALEAPDEAAFICLDAQAV